MGRLAPLTLIILACLASSASANPSGIVDGTVSATWSLKGGDWSGSVAIAMDPGAGPRDAAAKRIRQGDHYWQPNLNFLGGAHITSIDSRRVTTTYCDETNSPSTRSVTVTGLTDPELPISIDGLDFDLLRGRGTTQVELAEDNYSKPLPMSGLYFLPLPGHVSIRRAYSGCGESFVPESEDDELPAFSFGAESAVPPAVTRVLETTDLALKRTGGVWRAQGHITDNDSNVTVNVDYDYRLLGSIRKWQGFCKVPADKDLAHAHSAGAAVAIVKKAGFPEAHFAGSQPTQYHRRGHFYVDEKFTSSGGFTCYTGSPKIFLAR